MAFGEHSHSTTFTADDSIHSNRNYTADFYIFECELIFLQTT